ncbi:MAG: family 78 glycoside hydrolase catalytic domain [Gemmatimonadaceae bacterium]|nr:family 78 glycoside hydrolase catalytic domain [Chitinophagaceae bacterium]
MRIILLATSLLFSVALTAQTLKVDELICNHRENPIGIAVNPPALSWKLIALGRNISQSAYSVRVSTETGFAKNSIVWETGKTNSSESILIQYAGLALKPATRYFWQVKVWDQNGKPSEWSKPAFWETGLTPQDWKAGWIEPVQDTSRYIPAILLRKEFNLGGKKIQSARAYITSHGFYEMHINGKKVGDQVLTPGWTSYEKRLQYQVFDIKSLLTNDANATGVMLGDGWYRGSLGWTANWGVWGKKLALLCEIRIAFTDGTETNIISDGSWKSSQHGPITLNGIYEGESYDARKEIKGWDRPAFNDASWPSAKTLDISRDNLIATETVPVRVVSEIKPIKIFKTAKGLTVADLGQNLVGWIKLKVSGPSGTKIKIRHAEVLDKTGNFYTDNLRAASATAEYTLKGDGQEVYEPRFSFFGFRYISIDGFPGELTNENITGMVVHSDMKPAGSFECSNKLINQLQHNIVWGQKGNFLDVPTDCPQRDERLGWTGDAQAFCKTATYNMDVAAFFTKWLKDVSTDQKADGKVPFVVPDVLRNDGTSAGWGDVATITPWTMYQVYGDKAFLENQYGSMKAYVDYIRKKSGDALLWKGGSVFGDWLFYKSMAQTENDGFTSPDMIATMFFAYSADLVSRAATVLGKQEDANTYRKLYEDIKNVFNKNYVTGEGRVSGESQTAYVLALKFGLLPETLRKKATQYLVDDIKGRRNHLSTGFLGTPYLCHVLSENGFADVAYDLLLQETFPGWLYPVKMGATTIWERWDGQKTDSSFQDVGMNSFNHYAYGAIGDWMFGVVAGIEPASPGYKKISISPTPNPKLSFAKASYESRYGKIVSGWSNNNGKMVFNIEIPPNATAIIRLPGAKAETVFESGKSVAEGFTGFRQENNDLVFETGSGIYSFEYR